MNWLRRLALRTDRRTFLQRLAGLGALAGGLVLLRRLLLPPPLDAAERETLARFLATLAPQAESAGIAADVARAVAASRPGRRALAEGVPWLDARARERSGKPFRELDVEGREAVVGLAERAAPGSLPRYFYQVCRDETLRRIYSRRAAWLALGVPGPPQPDGRLDYQDAPARRA